MHADAQRPFDPRALDKAGGHALSRPVLKLSTAADVMDLSEQDTIAEICEGRVRWAWNLATGSSRPFVRVLTRSVVCWLLERDGTVIPQPTTHDEAVRAVLPPMALAAGTITGKELKRIFRVGHHHIAALVDDMNVLTERTRPAHAPRSGINGSRVLTTKSVIELLNKTQAPWN